MKETGKGCCKDEHKFLKNDTDQKTTKSAFKTIQLIAIALPASFVEITANNNFSSVTKENSFSYPPPRSRNIAVYICNCVFLI